MESTAHTLEVLAKTIYGEARGESFNGKVAVAYTIINRASSPGWWGKTIVEVCLKPYQFSCWLPDDPNSKLLSEVTIDSHAFRDCYAVACLVFNRTLPDPTNKATHYHALSMPVPPKWAATLKATTVIGGHKFFSSEFPSQAKV